MARVNLLRRQLLLISQVPAPVAMVQQGNVIMVCDCSITIVGFEYRWRCLACHKVRLRLTAYEDLLLAALRCGGWPAVQAVALDLAERLKSGQPG